MIPSSNREAPREARHLRLRALNFWVRQPAWIQGPAKGQFRTFGAFGPQALSGGFRASASLGNSSF
eukprot:6939146-Alexandrium_andersonii.AAC.1